jgi:SAM-dependent methyltransferase
VDQPAELTGPVHRSADVRASYDAVADEYTRRIAGELAHKPFDRELLDRFAAGVRGAGPVWELGCGPGHVARYLHERGVEVCGVDLSAAMVAEARRANPGVDFRQGDLRALDVADATLAGLVAFYSIIHLPRTQVTAALRGMRRALRPGGPLLLAFHVGDGTVHLDEWWDRPVRLDFEFFGSQEMAGYLRSAGFQVEQVVERDPYPEVDHPSRRANVLARRPPVGGG